MGKNVNKKIKIVDGRLRIDRFVYILGYEGKGYVVVNNNPYMDGDSTEVTVVPWKVRRGILVARLIPPNWERQINKSKIAIQGLEYDSDRLINEKLRLRVVGGSIEANNSGSYSTSTSCAYSVRENRRGIVQSMDPAIMGSLEQFSVPRETADMMRRYVSRHR